MAIVGTERLDASDLQEAIGLLLQKRGYASTLFYEAQMRFSGDGGIVLEGIEVTITDTDPGDARS